MKRKNLLLLALGWLLATASVAAPESVEKILPLEGRIAADGTSVELSWFGADPPRVGSVSINRRLYGQIGGGTWQPLATGLGPVMRYTDETTRPGIAYEYQITRSARDIVDAGYWLTGVDLPAQAQRGHAYVLVDETLTQAIAPRLQRFVRDLIGDGWQVHLQSAPRGDDSAPAENLKKALAIKTWLNAGYQQDPFGQHAIILVGHLPIMRSGKANPDGHNAVPHASDLFYADMDGRWTATRDGQVLDNQVPGDFIEMQIGRIDFKPVSNGQQAQEVHLLQAYFDKNHHWRSGQLGDLREAYGAQGHLQAETYALRNIVGPEAVVTGGHHDVGETQPWLWGVDFGDWDGRAYAEKYANKAVFAINFGSGKQKIGNAFNQMTALLAQPWYPLAVGWGARPTWWLHHMALGGTIGDVHLRTVNNGVAKEPYRESMDYFPTGRYLFRNPVWVNLLGDPTLRAFPLTPPKGLSARQSGDTMILSWSASADPGVIGYRVFRAPANSSVFAPLEGATLVTALEFTDIAPPPGARYMVRAYGKKTVHAGSFHRFSQGAFYSPDAAPLDTLAQDMVLEAPDDQPIALPAVFNSVQEGKIHALIEGPAKGALTHEAEGWLFTPPQGFTGDVPLRFSVSDRWRSQSAVLTIRIGE